MKENRIDDRREAVERVAMSKKWLKDNAILCWILVGFFVTLVGTGLVFSSMDKNIDAQNDETMREVGSLYVSSIARQVENHSKTYFESNFALIGQMLDMALSRNGEKEQVEYLQSKLQENYFYLSLIRADRKTEMILGDSSYVAYDQAALEDALERGENKVILIQNGERDKAAAMVLSREFSLGGQSYVGLMCGFPTKDLNSVFNLAYGDENLTYSFMIRKQDSAFVVRNEGAFRQTYFERVHDMYQNYQGMTAQDYIDEIASAMKENRACEAEFMMNGEKRMFYATPVPYSDWYLLTFIRYGEIDNILGDNNARRNSISTRHIGVLGALFLVVFGCYAWVSYGLLKKMQEKEHEAMMASKAKSDFLSNMSHDIRTPMNAIVGMTEIARAHLDDRERIENCLNKITLSSRHLLSLINDVLDMSKIESGKISLSMMQMSLQESMEKIVMIAQPQVRSKRQKFDIYLQDICAEEVYCDNLRLNQILINLISNAVKYTQEEGEIFLILSQEPSPMGDEYVRNHFRIKDNGAGMTEDFIKVVFESFSREDRKRTRKEEGTGLGLAITKHLVEAMGGTIEVRSKLKEGSEFHVTLDLKRGDMEKGDMLLDHLNVLVVDDNEEQCRNAQEMLQEIGAEAEYVVNGEQAVEKVREIPDRYDVILIDWQMPGLNGVETAREIRKYTGNDIPLILISAYDCSDFEEESKKAGINGFIAKPLFKSTLFFGIKQYIENKIESKKTEIKKEGFDGEHILLAEDNELNAEIALEILTSAGLSVKWVENGELCVKEFEDSEEGQYQVILMDIRMPVMDGYEATATIRALDRADSDIPIIAMTADAFAEDVARAMACGMNGHIAKPLDINRLLTILKSELEV